MTKKETVPVKDRTIAVDPDVIPLGSKVIFGGHEYIAEDTGGAIKGNTIDLYYGSEQESKDYGVKFYKVFIKKE